MFSRPVVLPKRANAPLAVLSSPVVLLKSAAAPVAVFELAVLAKSVAAPIPVLKLPLLRVCSDVGIAVVPCFRAEREQTMQRLTPAVLGARDVVLVVHPDLARVTRVRVVIDFLARRKSGEPRSGGDALEAQWVKREQLPEFKVSESACKVIAKAFEQRRS